MTGKILSGGGLKSGIHFYNDIISLENLLLAWQEFQKGKRKRIDVQFFEMNLMKNLISLHLDLKNKTYKHGSYQAFNIRDPKPRNIHKATVRDRLLHHAIYKILYPYFDKKFIFDSYSCRENKGTHRALDRFRAFFYKVSKNNTRICWVLKCDIKKFFASIDHSLLLVILEKHIEDRETASLLKEIIQSFETAKEKDLPLGNLTSQLLVNIYMNEFDQFVKHKLKAKYYIRYADDFVFLSHDKNILINNIRYIVCYLSCELKLILHPNKIFIKTFSSGIDFLGWVHFPTHRVLRATTRRRMFRNLKDNLNPGSVASYLGLLKHGDTYKIKKQLLLGCPTAK